MPQLRLRRRHELRFKCIYALPDGPDKTKLLFEVLDSEVFRAMPVKHEEDEKKEPAKKCAIVNLLTEEGGAGEEENTLVLSPQGRSTQGRRNPI